MKRARNRRVWLWGLGALVALASPIVYGYGRSEIAVGSRIEALGLPLPPTTAILKSGVGVDDGPAGCRGMAARTLASELGPAEIGAFYRGLDGRAAERVAFQRHRDFVIVDTRSGARIEGASELPAIVRKLLVEHAFLSDGLRRVVVFDEVELPAPAFDPRCW